MSLLMGALLGLSTASADVIVRVHVPLWSNHTHEEHCKHRPAQHRDGHWTFISGHWEMMGRRQVWVQGHWMIHPDRQQVHRKRHHPRRHHRHTHRR